MPRPPSLNICYYPMNVHCKFDAWFVALVLGQEITPLGHSLLLPKKGPLCVQ